MMVETTVEVDSDSVSDDVVEVMLVDSDDVVVDGIVEVVEAKLVVDDVVEIVFVGGNDVVTEEEVVDVLVVDEVVVDETVNWVVGVEDIEVVDDEVEVVVSRPAVGP